MNNIGDTDYTEEERSNIALVRTHIEGFAEHDIERSLSVVSDDVVDEDFGEPPKHGRGELEEEIQGYLDSFPDLKWNIDNIFAHDDQVLVEISGIGTRSTKAIDGGKPGTRVQFWVASVEQGRVHRRDSGRRQASPAQTASHGSSNLESCD